MNSAQSEAHLRLMQSLPISTHWREEPQEMNKYTGKALAPEELRQRRANALKESMRGRVNTFCPINGK